MIELSADLGGLKGYVDTVTGYSTAVMSNAYQQDVRNYASKRLIEKFNLHIDAMALAHARALHHVYEWNAVGIPNARLFRVIQYGRGRDRAVGFVFRQSVTKVPLPDAGAYGGGEDFRPRRRHIFRNKAYVMELNQRVSIKRRNAKALFIPMQGAEGGFIIRKGPIGVDNPGGKETTGRFTREWETFWSAIAPVHLESEIVPMITRHVKSSGDAEIRRLANTTRVRKRGININYVRGQEMAVHARTLKSARKYFGGLADDIPTE